MTLPTNWALNIKGQLTARNIAQKRSNSTGVFAFRTGALYDIMEVNSINTFKNDYCAWKVSTLKNTETGKLNL
jgi:hypothetical protein